MKGRISRRIQIRLSYCPDYSRNGRWFPCRLSILRSLSVGVWNSRLFSQRPVVSMPSVNIAFPVRGCLELPMTYLSSIWGMYFSKEHGVTLFGVLLRRVIGHEGNGKDDCALRRTERARSVKRPTA